jgi:hypothetical protein
MAIRKFEIEFSADATICFDDSFVITDDMHDWNIYTLRDLAECLMVHYANGYSIQSFEPQLTREEIGKITLLDFNIDPVLSAQEIENVS